MLAGFPVPRSGAGTVSRFQVAPSSADRYVSSQALVPSRRRTAVRISFGPSRTVEGMMA